MSENILILENQISAPIEQVYRAFTNSTAYREWMCDVCLSDPRPGGRLYFGWNGPFYAAGEFTMLETNHIIAFTWMGRGELAPTHVKVTLAETPDGTILHLEHGGLGEGEAWERAYNIFKASWESGLENLISVLETGRDLRIVNRPMLGVYIGQFDKETAHKLGVPVISGVRLEGVVEGMGAQRAGLQTNDIIVRMGTRDIHDYQDLNQTMQSMRAGTEVELEIYRQDKKLSVSIILSERPIPEVPSTAPALSAAVDQLYSEIMVKLDQLFEGVSETQASFQPAEGEWSAKEVLAHLIHSERGFQNSISEAIGSAEPVYDTYSENWSGRNYATLSAFPGIQDLIEEYKKLMQETVVLFSEIPLEFVARKSSYWRLVFNTFQLSTHFNSHAVQIKLALDAAPGE